MIDDFQKCFDSVDWTLVLSLSGLPPAVTGPLGDMWKHQVRWFTYGNQVHQEPVQDCRAILQGDLWGPLALAAVLAGPLRKIRERIPHPCFSICYMDDRSAGMADLPTLQTWLAELALFENHIRMKTNHSKTQVWARTAEAHRQLDEAGFIPSATMKILGATLGAPGRETTKDETDTLQAVVTVCRRCAILPASVNFKRQVAQAMASSKAVWGMLINSSQPSTMAVVCHKCARIVGQKKYPAYHTCCGAVQSSISSEHSLLSLRSRRWSRD